MGHDNSSALVGTSAERDAIKKEQDKEYAVSLANDQLKAKEKTRQQSLRDGRALRVPEIPPVGKPHVEVSVRHSNMGVVTRSFGPNHTVSVVYDWIGSLSLTPEHFTLSTHSAVDVSPSVPILAIDKVMLYMTAKESPNYPEDEITFLGYGSELSLLDDTVSSSVSSTNSYSINIALPLQPSHTTCTTSDSAANSNSNDTASPLQPTEQDNSLPSPSTEDGTNPTPNMHIR